MALLYAPRTMICKLWEQFSRYFSEETDPTKKHLFDLFLSVLALNGFQSVKFNYEHFIEEPLDFQLNSYYFTLNDSRIEVSEWMKRLTETALSIIPPQQGQQPIILSIDDTMIEKFENRSRLFDHAAHDIALSVCFSLFQFRMKPAAVIFPSLLAIGCGRRSKRSCP